MQFFTRHSPAARTALVYITVGTLMVVWTGVWWAYLARNPPTREAVYYICAGLSISGVLLLVIGLCLGRIGQSAKGAESPAEVTTTADAVAPAAPVAPVAAVAPPVAAAAATPAPAAGPVTAAPANAS